MMWACSGDNSDNGSGSSPPANTPPGDTSPVYKSCGDVPHNDTINNVSVTCRAIRLQPKNNIQSAQPELYREVSKLLHTAFRRSP